MILLFEGNPKLVTTYALDSIKEGEINTFSKKTLALGSPGIVAARVLRQYDEKVALIAPLGGAVGEKIKAMCKMEDLGLVDVSLKDDSLEELQLGLENSLIVQSALPRITQEEANRLFSTLAGYQEEIKTLLLLESNDFIQEKYPYFIKRAKDLKHPVFLHVQGALDTFIQDGIHSLVCSKEQIENASGLQCNFTHEVVKAAESLFMKGVKNVYVQGQGKTSIYLKEESFWTIQSSQEIKDLSLVATGLCAAYAKNYSTEMTLKFARALGELDKRAIEEGDYAQLKQRMNQIELKEGRID